MNNIVYTLEILANLASGFIDETGSNICVNGTGEFQNRKIFSGIFFLQLDHIGHLDLGKKVPPLDHCHFGLSVLFP